MAVQQNSTLIYDNLDECPSLLKEPEELSRYSPILPLKNQNNAVQQSTQPYDGKANNNNNNKNKNQNFNPKIKEFHKYRKYASNRLHRNHAPSTCSAQSGRSRTISLNGANSAEEQGQKEIPIWLDDEPRYVSGVNSRTTCNDIIKALIDDEIRNGGNHDYCANRGKFDAASRDYNDYVITESWRGIERSYDGNMAILPVWKAWSRVHNEIRLSLKHYKEVAEPTPPKQNRNWLQSLRKYFAKLFKFRKRNKELPLPIKDKHQKPLLTIKEEESPDEIVFILLPDKKYDNGSAHPPTKEVLYTASNSSDSTTKADMLKRKLYSLSETRVSMRRKKRLSKTAKRNCEKLRESPLANAPEVANNCIRRRKDAPIRNSIRHKLAQKTNEIDKLYKRELELTKRLNHKCQLYKLSNELYSNADQRLELSIGQIQRNVEQYAEQIIQTEHELRELKNEIRQDISLVNNLKRMTLDAVENVNDCGVPPAAEMVGGPAPTVVGQEAGEQPQKNEGNTEMQFVDNIYEFCDNNASMLV
ncbi:uncharacterized protein LOC118738913 [Rhagoletis pomonella]|uniref:uncharacterized protein LOC118738913 n=1 Tax=Rhagoletis pomonella TaxID=28610 RepID=UPI00177E9CB7|nr:uncharacterized protein LOC118738913 [Rhagoletis pomonella]